MDVFVCSSPLFYLLRIGIELLPGRARKIGTWYSNLRRIRRRGRRNRRRRKPGITQRKKKKRRTSKKLFYLSTPQKTNIDTKKLPFLKGVTFSKPSFWVSMRGWKSNFVENLGGWRLGGQVGKEAKKESHLPKILEGHVFSMWIFSDIYNIIYIHIWGVLWYTYMIYNIYILSLLLGRGHTEYIYIYNYIWMMCCFVQHSCSRNKPGLQLVGKSGDSTGV